MYNSINIKFNHLNIVTLKKLNTTVFLKPYTEKQEANPVKRKDDFSNGF